MPEYGNSQALTWEMHLKRCREVLKYALESTDDPCQCGFYEELAEDGKGGWGRCWKCAAEQQLEDMSEVQFTEVQRA